MVAHQRQGGLWEANVDGQDLGRDRDLGGDGDTVLVHQFDAPVVPAHGGRNGIVAVPVGAIGREARPVHVVLPVAVEPIGKEPGVAEVARMSRREARCEPEKTRRSEKPGPCHTVLRRLKADHACV